MATTRTRRSKIKESAGGGGVGKSRNADPKRVMERGGRKKEGKRRSVDGDDEMKKKKRKEDDGGSEMHVERSEIRGEDEQKRKKEEEDDGGSGMHVERSENRGEDEQKRKKKEEEEEDDGGSEMHVERSKDRGKDDKERSGDGDGERPKPVGGAVESGGNVKRYSAFDYDGRRYQLEDSVLVTPAEENTRPGVGIIKEISEALDGSMSVTVQWFYRPEDLETADEESWLSLDNRELLISNDQDEVPAESLMHNCVVHFLAEWKQLPDRKKHPGFVVLYFYDHLKQKVYKITDEDYMDSLQKEIHQRIQETQLRIGFEDSSPPNNDQDLNIRQASHEG